MCIKWRYSIWLSLWNRKYFKINSVDNEIYVLGHFDMFLLNDSYVLEKIISWIASKFQVMIKNIKNFVYFMDQSNK